MIKQGCFTNFRSEINVIVREFVTAFNNLWVSASLSQKYSGLL